MEFDNEFLLAEEDGCGPAGGSLSAMVSMDWRGLTLIYPVLCEIVILSSESGVLSESAGELEDFVPNNYIIFISSFEINNTL